MAFQAPPELDTAALRAELAEARRLNAQLQADNQTLRASRADYDPALIVTVNPRIAMLDDFKVQSYPPVCPVFDSKDLTLIPVACTLMESRTTFSQYVRSIVF
jgi:hypothetical protein